MSHGCVHKNTWIAAPGRGPTLAVASGQAGRQYRSFSASRRFSFPSISLLLGSLQVNLTHTLKSPRSMRHIHVARKMSRPDGYGTPVFPASEWGLPGQQNDPVACAQHKRRPFDGACPARDSRSSPGTRRRCRITPEAARESPANRGPRWRPVGKVPFRG
jgi:hypothetical protein